MLQFSSCDSCLVATRFGKKERFDDIADRAGVACSSRVGVVRGSGAMWLIIIAGLLWGVTNPLLKKFTQGFAAADATDADVLAGGTGGAATRTTGLLADLRFLFSRPKYLITQGLNLLGSVAFTVGMGEASLSVGPAVANGLAMAVTCAMSTLVLNEEPMASRTAFGVGLIFAGLVLCVTAGS